MSLSIIVCVVLILNVILRIATASPTNLISALDYEGLTSSGETFPNIQSIESNILSEEKQACPIPELPLSDLENCRNNQLPESYAAKCWMKCFKEEASGCFKEDMEINDPYCASGRPSDVCELAYWKIRCMSKEVFVAIYEICLHIFD